MKRNFLDDVVATAEFLAEKTERIAVTADRMKVAVNSIVGSTKTIQGIVAPLLGLLKSR